jgi:hypothetical protein
MASPVRRTLRRPIKLPFRHPPLSFRDIIDPTENQTFYLGGPRIQSHDPIFFILGGDRPTLTTLTRNVWPIVECVVRISEHLQEPHLTHFTCSHCSTHASDLRYHTLFIHSLRLRRFRLLQNPTTFIALHSTRTWDKRAWISECEYILLVASPPRPQRSTTTASSTATHKLMS